jgi:hypothetical protein
MRLIVHDTEIKYEPPFSDFEIGLVNIIEMIIKYCSHIPRVETRLYSDSAVNIKNSSFKKNYFYNLSNK